MAARTRSPFVPTFAAGQPVWREATPPRFGFPFRLLLILALLPLLLGVSMIVVYRQQQTDRIYPGVSVFDVSLGRMTRDQAAQAIKGRVADYARRPFLLRYDDDAISVNLASLGLQLDDAAFAAMADRALAVGKEDDLRPWLQSQLDLMRDGYVVQGKLSVDRERAAAVLARVAVDVERPTLNATFSVEKVGERYEIHTSPAHSGRRLNVGATIDRIQQSLDGALPAAVELALDEAPPAIADADIAPAIETIQRVLEAPLEIKDGDRAWRLDANATYGMLEIHGLDSGTPPVTAVLNEAKLRDFVEKSARVADQPAINPSFAIDGDQIVVRPASPGRLADAQATFDKLVQIAGTTMRTVDMVFKDDRPWLTEADLEPYRIQANAILNLPLIIEAPAGILPTPVATPAAGTQSTSTAGTPTSGTPQPTPTPRPAAVVGGISENRSTSPAAIGTPVALGAVTLGASPTPLALPTSQPQYGRWVIDRKQLVQLIALPSTQSAPRDYATLPPAQRPRFDLALDSAKVSAYLQREVGSWVSLDPIDAELQLKTTQVEVPNPAYAAVLGEQRRQAAAQPTPSPGAVGSASVASTPVISVPATITETRYSVELRNAKDGRGPDLQGTYLALQSLFRGAIPPGPLAPVPPLNPAPTTIATPRPGVTPLPTATPLTAAGIATLTAMASAVPLPTQITEPGDLAQRTVTLRMAPRTPRVQDRELAGARDFANALIGQPVTLRWNDATWIVTQAELASMLRYQTANGALTAYLTRDGLLEKAQAIAREAERRPDAPRDSEGNLMPLDVPRTAAAIWEQASTNPDRRVADVVWTEEEPKAVPTAVATATSR